jgi:type I restriction enzyme M protein
MANGTGANLGFEADLFKAADKLRGNMEPSDYKHVALGLIFLKYISDAFMEMHNRLANEEYGEPEDQDEYLAENVFWVPPEARWPHLQKSAKQAGIGQLVDDAMKAIERDNVQLKGVLPKDYARPALDQTRLGELIDLIATIGLGDAESRKKDILGRVYEYFLARFAEKEGKGGGEFYTPQCVVRLLVEMLEPFKGRVYDPCCGSGGMFVSAAKFVTEHASSNGNGKSKAQTQRQISIFGQESNYTTWRLALMNLAIRGIDAQIKWGDSFLDDKQKDLRADFIPRSTWRTGAIPRWRTMCAGSTARPPRAANASRRTARSSPWTAATPTMPGFSTSSITWPRTAPPVSCWPTAPCPRTPPARATSARPSSRPTWWTV